MTAAVSVIVPCYNAEKTLRMCLESVFAQSHRPVEVIVVDDASTDSSARIAEELGCVLVEQRANGGVSAARNAGVAASRGEVLFFLDSDVALAVDAVAAAVRMLADDPGCGCVFGVYAKEPLMDDGPVETYRTLHLHHALTRAVGVTKTAVFALAGMPRRVFDDIGPFDEKLRSGEDDEYSERLLTRYRIRLSATVTGWHDEADRLVPLLVEQFRRAQLLPFMARNRFRRGAIAVNRTSGVLAAALTIATVPLAVAHRPLGMFPVAAFAAFVAADPALARFVVREKGFCFLLYFTAVHFLTHLALLSGAAVGAARTALDPSFGPTQRRKG